MSRIEIVSIEQRNFRGPAPEWTAALSTLIGRVAPSSWSEPLAGGRPEAQHFWGRIEFGSLGDIVLARIRTGTPHRLAFSLRDAMTPHPPVILLLQRSGSCRIEQAGRSCLLDPGDWCVIDTRRAFQIWSPDATNENLSLRLDRPSDPELLQLLDRGGARRWRAIRGASRIMQAALSETFREMNTLCEISEAGLQQAVQAMVWTALREQLAAPTRVDPQDLQRARIKRVIDARLARPDLAVDSIARASGLSVRSVHRAFAADPAGSVSRYMWKCRLNRCAAELRDPAGAARPITEICLSWGFNSTSHFSRLFKEQFGCTPREYRRAAEEGGAPSSCGAMPNLLASAGNRRRFETCATVRSR